MSETETIEPASIDAEETPRFDFDEAFQTKIAALVLKDTSFNTRTRGLIKPDYFENSAEASIVSVVLNYFGEYGKSPDLTTFSKLMKDAYAAKVVREDLRPAIYNAMKALLKTDISDRDFVVDEVAKFARHQAVTQAVLFAADVIGKVDAEKFEKISRKMRDALDVGALEEAEEYDYFGEIDKRTIERKLRAAGELPPTGITTGVRQLDAALYHRGWGKKEISVLMGGAKVGKTTAMIEFAKNAAMADKKVLYITLEVSARIISERLDANISETKVMSLGDKIMEVDEKIREAADKASRLVIREFPTGSLTVSSIRRLLNKERAKGIIYDLLVIDYADLMAPEARSKEPREDMKSIYIDLRALAFAEDLAILTATQTNREGFKSSVAKAEHVAENFEKIRIADLVISINSSDEEREIGEARLFFVASRNQKGGYQFRIKQDLERMKFCERIIEEIKV